MTQELLNKVAKENKININEYDSVIAFIDSTYTWLYITFATYQNCGGNRRYYNNTSIKKSVSAINKKMYNNPEMPMADDFCTEGWEYIYNIK